MKIACLTGMIKGIGLQSMMDFPRQSQGAFPVKHEGVDFQSLLQKKLEESKVLEKVAIEYLSRAIETILSSRIEGSEFSAPFPAPIPSSVQPSGLNLKLEPEPRVPKNLQGNQKFEPLVEEAGQKYGVEPSLIKAIIETESGGNPRAVSPAGAQGLMQMMPGTAAELGVQDPFNPAENIMAGTRYFRQLLDRYQGSTRLALAAYNWGMGNLENHPGALPKETKNYIAKVESYYQSYLQSSPTA